MAQFLLTELLSAIQSHAGKVVEWHWYEKNKHIFPASVWEEFDPAKDYTKGIRKDVEGNSFFFSWNTSRLLNFNSTLG